MIRPKDLQEWLEHPVTREYRELLVEHREASYKMVTEFLINSPSLGNIDLSKVAEFRGQVYTFDSLLDLRHFLLERVEVKNDKVHSLGAESDSEGSTESDG